MKRLLETAVILLGTLGWWGFVYPELCLTEEVYQQEDAESMAETGNSGEIGRIRIKCRMAEYVYQVRMREAAEMRKTYEK